MKTINTQLLSTEDLTKKQSHPINFRVDIYFDPYGDGKSKRKILKREYYYSFKSRQEILDRFDDKLYYGSEVVFTDKNYKKAKSF